MAVVRQRQLSFQNDDESYYNHQGYLKFTALWTPLLTFYFGLGRCHGNEPENVKDHQSSWNNTVFTCVVFTPQWTFSPFNAEKWTPPESGSDFSVTCWSREVGAEDPLLFLPAWPILGSSGSSVMPLNQFCVLLLCSAAAPGKCCDSCHTQALSWIHLRKLWTVFVIGQVWVNGCCGAGNTSLENAAKCSFLLKNSIKGAVLLCTLKWDSPWFRWLCLSSHIWSLQQLYWFLWDFSFPPFWIVSFPLNEIFEFIFAPSLALFGNLCPGSKKCPGIKIFFYHFQVLLL